jgi:excisionase family DNA binding protein
MFHASLPCRSAQIVHNISSDNDLKKTPGSLMSLLASDYISTPQAAQALGVSVSTIKRWVDEGRLPAHKTAGGHRKLLRAEVLALARQGELPSQDLSELFPGVTRGQQVSEQSLAAVLHQALLSGAPEEARALVNRAYRSGMTIEQLADRVVAPVMEKIGHEWESSRIDVWQEHRSTELCLAALHDLMPGIARRAQKKLPLTIGAAPAGDYYRLPTFLAQLVLLDAGWNAVNLGPNTPFENLLSAARELLPRLIWLSVSHVPDSGAFVRDYRAFYQEATGLGVAVAVGGRALTDTLRTRLPYTFYGDGLTHLAAFARSLHPPPARPRRGRPPNTASNARQ